MATSSHELNWSDIAFGDKSVLRGLRAVFIAAPREISESRFKQLVKEYLPRHHIVLGIAKESYVLGFEGQVQFKTLQLSDSLQALIEKVNAASSQHKVTVLRYSQRDTVFVLENGKFSKVLLVNGSWQYAFHHRPEYYKLTSRRADFERISAFVDEDEAKQYAQTVCQQLADNPVAPSTVSDTEMMMLTDEAAKRSFDYTFQTGAALASRNNKGEYTYLMASHNTVVPYETYALLYGSTRESHFSPLNDQNYYDTVHAEAMLLLEAMEQGVKLDDTSLFVNLMPCPACTRILAATSIHEIVYARDHSNGYAITLLEQSGKAVRRLTLAESED